MFRLVARLVFLAITSSCVLAAFLAMLFSTAPVASSSFSVGPGEQAMIEQSPSDPPLPDELPLPNRLFLPQVSKTGDGGADERPPQKSVHIAGTDAYTERVPPPVANLYTFVSDTGGDLDQYLSRAGTLDGKLTFTIAITAPVLPEAAVNPVDGFLHPLSAITLTNQHVLPKQAMLTLRVWDVDDDEGLSCPETDNVLINGNRLRTLDWPYGAYLRGGNDKWRTWSVFFPSDLLRFPTAVGIEGGQPPLPAINDIAIEVDAECPSGTWAVEVDWGAIVLGPSTRYSVLLAHGWTGDSDTFKVFSDFAIADGYNMKRATNLASGIENW
jgi:hypothetical protein